MIEAIVLRGGTRDATLSAVYAGAWLHGAAAKKTGIGMIAEDTPEAMQAVLRELSNAR